MSTGEPTEHEHDPDVETASGLLQMVSELALPLERSAIIERIGRIAADSIGADLGFVGLLDGPDSLSLTAVHGGETEALEGLEVERGRGLGGQVLASATPGSVADYTQAESITHEYDKPISEEGLAGVLCIPLSVGEDLLGVAYVSDRVPTVYSDVAVDRVLTAVESAKLALSLASRSHEITEAAIEAERERTMEALGKSVGEGLEHIVHVARVIESDPDASHTLSSLAKSIIHTAGAASEHLAAGGVVTPDPRPYRSVLGFDPNLTDREREVLHHASLGLSNPEIAAQLYLARGTIKAYMESILRKLHARNRVEAVMIAARAGLLD